MAKPQINLTLEEKHVIERGLLSQINGKFYIMGAERSEGGAALILHIYEEGEWKRVE